jgi:hypothetical protein
MLPAKVLSLSSLLLLAAGCVGPSTAAKGAPSGAADAAPSASAADAKVRQTRVVCEYVRPSGSNIMQRECREIPVNGEDPSKKRSENWFKPGPPPPTSSSR